jgi:hypothetical protein
MLLSRRSKVHGTMDVRIFMRRMSRMAFFLNTSWQSALRFKRQDHLSAQKTEHRNNLALQSCADAGAAGADGCPRATKDALGHGVGSRAREIPARKIPHANTVDSGNAGIRSDVVEIVEMLPGRAPEVGVVTNVVAVAIRGVGGVSV